jgi:hypothetical protein
MTGSSAGGSGYNIRLGGRRVQIFEVPTCSVDENEGVKVGERGGGGDLLWLGVRGVGE